MSQITRGIRLALGVTILYGSGDPNAQQTASLYPAVTNQDVNQAGAGSLFLRQDGGSNTCLYVCESSYVPATTTTSAGNAVWVAK